MTGKGNGASSGFASETGILTEFRAGQSFANLILSTTPVILESVRVRVHDSGDRIWLNGIVNLAAVAGGAPGTITVLFEILRGDTVIYSIQQTASFPALGGAFLNVQLQHVDSTPLADSGGIPASVLYQLRATALAIPAGAAAATVSQIFTAAEIEAS